MKTTRVHIDNEIKAEKMVLWMLKPDTQHYLFL